MNCNTTHYRANSSSVPGDPTLALEQDPSRREHVDELLRKTHTLKGAAATVGLSAVSEAVHRLEGVFAALRAGRLRPEESVFDELMGAADALRALVEAEATGRPIRELGRRLDEELRALADADDSTPTRRRRLATHDQGPPIVQVMDDPDPTGGDEHVLTDRRRGDRRKLRVDASAVDELMDAVGELVFDRTRIERRVQELRGVVRGLARTRAAMRALVSALRGPGAPDAAARVAELEAELAGHVAQLLRGGATLMEDTESLRRTTGTVQQGLTQMRMLPLSRLFQRLARPLRDLARAQGKRVELITSGEDAELDKVVVEQITDPLVALLRNAVAHGIEPAEERARRGKPPAGRIRLAARHQGDSVFLEVSDDGAGIDADRVRRALVAAGRMAEAEAATASAERIIAAIFEPGVSSREAADELAGRGIGLDLVRESIARLGGEIAVSSTPGEGTRFVIRLPLTTAITQALLFKVGGQVYALPHLHVAETTFLESDTAAPLPSHLAVREERLPLVSLHRVLDAELPAGVPRLPAVVLDYAGRRLAVTCDRVIGAREIIVKSLGPLLAPLALYAGATISAAGKVQLILDPATLVQLAYPPDEHAAASAPSRVPAGAGASTSVPPRPAEGTPPARLLVVDDSRSVRESVYRMLSAEGYVVDLAASGQEAWQMLGELPYDLLVTDLEMPDLDGYGLIERVRQRNGSPTLPIVVISSQKTPAHRQRAEKAGADAFLPKPVTRRAIAERVSELLRRCTA